MANCMEAEHTICSSRITRPERFQEAFHILASSSSNHHDWTYPTPCFGCSGGRLRQPKALHAFGGCKLSYAFI